ncbi:hypothetical protein FB446DRAFT_782881 [Lentinula raphanica]|nr:hypothetical protein FB446DRAFT_782881 [Lentinula raphanica]
MSSHSQISGFWALFVFVLLIYQTKQSLRPTKNDIHGFGSFQRSNNDKSIGSKPPCATVLALRLPFIFFASKAHSICTLTNDKAIQTTCTLYFNSFISSNSFKMPPSNNPSRSITNAREAANTPRYRISNLRDQRSSSAQQPLGTAEFLHGLIRARPDLFSGPTAGGSSHTHSSSSSDTSPAEIPSTSTEDQVADIATGSASGSNLDPSIDESTKADDNDEVVLVEKPFVDKHAKPASGDNDSDSDDEVILLDELPDFTYPETSSSGDDNVKAAGGTDDDDDDEVIFLEKEPVLTPEQRIRRELRDTRRELRLVTEQLDETANMLANVREAARDRNTCKICFEFFRFPYMLTCGHAFCGPCLTQWGKYLVDNDYNPSCPKCRAQLGCFTPFVPLHIKDDVADMFFDQGLMRPESSELEWPEQFESPPLIIPFPN